MKNNVQYMKHEARDREKLKYNIQEEQERFVKKIEEKEKGWKGRD
jgi:hypothetical protein